MNIVIGYVYNLNGMASWCIESAYALKQAGHNVLLIAANTIELPDDLLVLRFEAKRKPNYTFKQKLLNKVLRFRNSIPFLYQESGFLAELNNQLKSVNFNTDIFLLNQSNLFSKKIGAKQLVVAWANKPFLIDYIRRVFVLNKDFRTILSALYDALYWYNSDWYAYRNAYATLAVTKDLQQNISKCCKNVYEVYPPYVLKRDPQLYREQSRNKIHIGFFALNIDDPRKGYTRLVSYLSQWSAKDTVLIELIGNVSDLTLQELQTCGIKFIAHGLLPRDEAVKRLRALDILAFASLIDDWGFVQTEAMANGVLVLAPNMHPSDEIVGNLDLLYAQGSQDDFLKKLANACEQVESNPDIRVEQHRRYANCFSGLEFVRKIHKILVVE
jgi:hypothetical protein